MASGKFKNWAGEKDAEQLPGLGMESPKRSAPGPGGSVSPAHPVCSPMRVRGQSLELMRCGVALCLNSQVSRLKQYQPPVQTVLCLGLAACRVRPPAVRPGEVVGRGGDGGGDGTNLPKRSANVHCLWTPSGSSCKGAGRRGVSGVQGRPHPTQSLHSGVEG